MSRYLGPRLKLVRKLGKLPGLTNKVPKIQKKQSWAPKKKKKMSQFAKRLNEKQKIRYNYGIGERQLLNYVRKARNGNGSAGETLLQLLEMRLDCIIFRLGFAPTIPAARQLVNHGHVLVNNKPVNIASSLCKVNDEITIKIDKSPFEPNHEFLPTHLAMKRATKDTAIVKEIVERNQIDLNIKELLIIEYYSRKV